MQHELTEEHLVKVPGLLSRWVRLADGSRAHYVTAGESGPAVILLHGGAIGSSGTAGWANVAPQLAAHGLRVYCPDMPGFGLADTRPEYGVNTIKDYVKFVDQFADALCLDRFHLAGNSRGANVTVLYVQAFPERLLSVAVIGGNAWIGDLGPEKDPAGTEGVPKFEIARFDGTEDSMRNLIKSLTFQRQEPEDAYVAMRTHAANLQWNAGIRGQSGTGEPMTPGIISPLTGDPDVDQWISTKHRWPQVTVPSIFLLGKQDHAVRVAFATGRQGLHLEDHLPNSQFFYLDQCGHQVQGDQPDLVTQLLGEFFGSGKISRPTAEAAGVSRQKPEIAEMVAA